MPMEGIKKVSLLLLFIALTGCGHYQPYVRPERLPSVQEREDIYNAHKVSANRIMPWVQVGGHFVYHGNVSQYMRASGDPASATIFRGFRVYAWVALIAALGELASGAEYSNYHPGKQGFIISANIVLLSPLLENAILELGKRKRMAPAADSFNKYLRESLQLPLDNSAGPSPGGNSK